MKYLPLCSGNMHMQAYFSIFTLIMPSKANQFNQYSSCCWRSARALLPLPADFSICLTVRFNGPLTPLNSLKVDYHQVWTQAFWQFMQQKLKLWWAFLKASARKFQVCSFWVPWWLSNLNSDITASAISKGTWWLYVQNLHTLMIYKKIGQLRMVDSVKQNCSLLFFIQFLYKTFQLLWPGVSG